MSDDRNQNQLVINEDGHFTMLSNAETYDAFLYPVRIGSWNPRNLYVGKYSDLSHLDDTYKYFVYGWAMYLSSEETFFDDYIPEFGDIEAILEEIKKYYSK